MQKLPLDMIAEINSLQRMDAKALRSRYGDLLAGFERCRKVEPLRAEIAYRLQERFYGISLPETTRRRIESLGGGREERRKDLPLSGTRLLREWKGVTHEVIVRDDGVIEYGDGLYRSLSAVARKITGTNWNGRVFFGLAK